MAETEPAVTTVTTVTEEHPIHAAFRKAEEWTRSKGKHVTAQEFATHALFPLLRKMWNAHVEQFEELAEVVFDEDWDAVGEGEEEDEGGAIIGTEFLDMTHEFIVKCMRVIDATLVKAGFATVHEGGAIDTTKLPPDIASIYAALGADYVEWTAEFAQTRAEAAEIEEEEETTDDAPALGNGDDAAEANGEAHAGS